MSYKKKVRDGKRFVLLKEKQGNTLSFFRQDKEDKNKEILPIYDLCGNQIRYGYDGIKVKTLLFEGFKELPPVVSDIGFGFENRSINKFFRFKFDKPINTIIISETERSQEGKGSITINLEDLEALSKAINQEQRACEDTKRTLISNFLNQHYPALKYQQKETNNNKDLILRNLNKKLIDQLTADDVERIGQFYVDAAQKYKRHDVVRRMLLDLQKNAQLLTLQEVIKQYEVLLASNPLESEWQKFFDEYITLFDNRYITKLDQKNIATGIVKYPDLVLVDIYGYVDFYELKRSSTKLLQYDKSHKTYYWSNDMSMAIAQASDYLQKAKENGTNFAKAIKSETSADGEGGLEISIVNPRAIIVAGQSSDLTNDKMRHQFKNLREGLKNIEFLLYDELLHRLQNLLDSVRVK